MSLNIKNPRTHALVRRLSEVTGLSQTSAVEQAVERWLHELERDADGDADERLDTVLAEIRAAWSDDDIAAMKREMDEMYDENGLPR